MDLNQISKTMTADFGSRNERLLKSYLKRGVRINEHEAQRKAIGDYDLTAKTQEFIERSKKGETRETLLPEVMAVARETMDRAVGIRNIFDEQFEFDPDQLDEPARKLFDEAKEKASALEPQQAKGGEP